MYYHSVTDDQLKSVYESKVNTPWFNQALENLKENWDDEFKGNPDYKTEMRVTEETVEFHLEYVGNDPLINREVWRSFTKTYLAKYLDEVGYRGGKDHIVCGFVGRMRDEIKCRKTIEEEWIIKDKIKKGEEREAPILKMDTDAGLRYLYELNEEFLKCPNKDEVYVQTVGSRCSNCYYIDKKYSPILYNWLIWNLFIKVVSSPVNLLNVHYPHTNELVCKMLGTLRAEFLEKRIVPTLESYKQAWDKRTFLI